jgi:hypothetical protein
VTTRLQTRWAAPSHPGGIQERLAGMGLVLVNVARFLQ